LLGCPDLASRAWVINQYDTTVMGNTIFRPGQADAALVRIEGKARALAITTDCTPRWCLADPELGGAHAVAEAWRNITATGARPLAITDNMNFGNPRKPEIMGQFAAAVMGMRAACLALDFPVVSGNVSLYNETEGRPILPTPAIGGVGVIDDAARAVGLAMPAGQALVLVGETGGHLGASLWLREILGREDGPPPPLDLAAERRNGDFVRAEILAGSITACHDCSDGGLLVALAEMAMASGVGATLLPGPDDMPPHAFWFGEDASRYVLATGDAAALVARARAAGVPARLVGRAGGEDLTLAPAVSISVARLREINRAWFKTFMEGSG
ncbi:MAG: phosphoribosylformylglycinamidine synthase II, partial [Acetobacteraceae bacterium]|nr:phosphoribosylformylglycinamidine synthase II [Acetobacteraceae bacterium]